ncbi:ribbon-helix-helix protein, CopG family [Quisquiliibacterium transsilvanicum]|uniref:Arc/MetJ-type ribon-helix-helix transcriptional regulator n=1 Tax=Quisquiliibacterium transsilvanicum TaxID=1549638 RepID=A0A7W8HIU1_9BURK|nr:ribbon-helix-helix protein, CopG family [Quisquiliibacterium transsilvanicum]MBB5272859.1 Arc/MetJ-type ribon-helix-helix transcriptional regulator [Quisquiliibacterium transsilvanicum]
MPQINLHVSAEFEASLEALMRHRGLRSKSEAIRLAVQEAAAPYRAALPRDFSLLENLLPQAAPGRPPMASLDAVLDREMDGALATSPASSAPGTPAARKRQ